MARKVSVNILDADSIRQAQADIERFKQDVMRMFDSLIESLTRDGAEFARARVITLDAVMTGELADSVEGIYNPLTRTGVIKVSADHAVYVEFGTGIVGASSSHPEASGNYRTTGWWYWSDYSSNWVYTEGMASRPFMYETWKYLTEKVRGLNK